MIRAVRRALAVLAVSFAVLSGVPAAAQPGGVPLPERSCQRECLEGFVDKYLQAMADGNVDTELFAPTARFTEYGVQLTLGNAGLWAPTTDQGHYRFYVPSTPTRMVTFMCTRFEPPTT